MSDTQTPVPGTKLDLRTLTYVAYGLYALGFLSSGFLGIATLASVVLMYLKRADVAGTFYAAHFDWLLRTFWWALLWMAISALAVYIFIGWIGLAATVVWVLYRLIRACWRCWRATRRRITPDADLSPSNQGRLLPALSLAPHLWSAVGSTSAASPVTAFHHMARPGTYGAVRAACPHMKVCIHQELSIADAGITRPS